MGACTRWCVLNFVPDPDLETFRLLLVEPASNMILMDAEDEMRTLPRIHVPRWSRASSQLVQEMKRRYGVSAVILDEFEHPSPFGSVVIAEAIQIPPRRSESDLQWRPFSELAPEELLEQEIEVIQRLLVNGATGRGPFSRLHWLDDVVQWTSQKVDADPADVRAIQVNGSADSTLIRFELRDGRSYWFKAAASPQDSEYAVTTALQRLLPEYLPSVVAHRQDWHAWLMEDAGLSLDGLSLVRPRLIEELGRHVASLQKASQRVIPSLLQSGCQDQRPRQLSQAIPELMDRLDAASGAHRTSIRVPKASGFTARLQEIVAELEDLQIPSTLVHGDLNITNVLIDEGLCVFTDWARTSVGHPIANLEQLRSQILANEGMSGAYSRLVEAYLRTWSEQIPRARIQQAMKLIPPVAHCMYLQSRLDWFTPERLKSADFARFTRHMARTIERAVLNARERLAFTA